MRRRETLTPLGAATLQHQSAILGRHARPEAMRLGPATIVRLKCALRHSLLFSGQMKSVRLTATSDYVKKRGPFKLDSSPFFIAGTLTHNPLPLRKRKTRGVLKQFNKRF